MSVRTPWRDRRFGNLALLILAFAATACRRGPEKQLTRESLPQRGGGMRETWVPVPPRASVSLKFCVVDDAGSPLDDVVAVGRTVSFRAHYRVTGWPDGAGLAEDVSSRCQWRSWTLEPATASPEETTPIRHQRVTFTQPGRVQVSCTYEDDVTPWVNTASDHLDLEVAPPPPLPGPVLIALIAPGEGKTVPRGQPVQLSWRAVVHAERYELAVMGEHACDSTQLSVEVAETNGVVGYDATSLFRSGTGKRAWAVRALATSGRPLTAWSRRTVHVDR